jgi:uncharacterized protein (TIGR03067 family)
MRQDLDLLQGSWSVTALNVEGQKMSADMLANAQITIKGNRFTSTGMGAVYKGTLELDASKSPQHLTMKFDAGPEKGNTNLGIYKLEGDTLKLCLATRGAVRPSRFAAPAGSGFALETLTRGVTPAPAKTKTRASKKAVPAKSASAPDTEFAGEWRLVSGVMDGHAMEESIVKWVKRVTEGNQTTVYAGPQVMLKVEFSSDASQSPKAIDYFGLAGSTKGRAQAGIYEFDGDLLKFCVAPPGAARPAQFQSAKGDGRTLTVWKRA